MKLQFKDPADYTYGYENGGTTINEPTYKSVDVDNVEDAAKELEHIENMRRQRVSCYKLVLETGEDVTHELDFFLQYGEL